VWSVAEAKAQLSEVLRRARGGEPQFIGTQEPGVVISARAFKEKFENKGHDGAWLVDQASHVAADIQLPSRVEDRADISIGGVDE
jgi:prevent-host-death family protein